MTFSLSLYSGWRVKNPFKDVFFRPSGPISSQLVVLLIEVLAWRGAWLLFAHLAVIQCRMWHTGVSGHWARSHSIARNYFPCTGKGVSRGEFSLSAYYPSQKGLMDRKRHFCQADENLQQWSFSEATAAGNPITERGWALFASQIEC